VQYALSPYIKQIGFIFKGLREEKRLRVFGKRALRRVFGPYGEEVTGDGRK
jgi:hypothetical protein